MYLKSIAEGSIGIVSYIKGMGEALQSVNNNVEPTLPNNIIRYKAANKLSETTSDKTAGLHTNRFNTSIISHEFEDGIGIITFSEDVTTILAYAFYLAPIIELEMPDSVTTLTTSSNAGAFYLCPLLESIKLSKNLTLIADYTFYANSKLNNVIIPDSVTSIGSNAFSQCSSLTSIDIPDNVISIGTNVFYYCTGLTNVTIGSGITSIGSQAFSGCNNLQKVITNDIDAWCKISFLNNLSNPLYYTRHLYIDENTEITDLVIPNDVTIINSYVFINCDSLISVTIPDSVHTVSESAFYNCNNLNTITINTTYRIYVDGSNFTEAENLIKNGNGVLSVGLNSFGKAKNVYIQDINSWANSSFGKSITDTGYNLYINNLLVTDLQISDTHSTNVGNYVFHNCISILSVQMHNVEMIGREAFSFCVNLRSIISTTDENYGEVFEDEFFKGCMFIGDYAFAGCINLTVLDISNYIDTIGSSIVSFNRALSHIILRSPTPPKYIDNISEILITDDTPDGSLYSDILVPLQYLDAYRAKWDHSGSYIYPLQE